MKILFSTLPQKEPLSLWTRSYVVDVVVGYMLYASIELEGNIVADSISVSWQVKIIPIANKVTMGMRKRQQDKRKRTQQIKGTTHFVGTIQKFLQKLCWGKSVTILCAFKISNIREAALLHFYTITSLAINHETDIIEIQWDYKRNSIRI